jgi:alcohol dehydrogenase (NADP+)
MVQFWNEGSGGARAIGVSNYNISHIKDIIDAGLPLPAYNQIPFNIYTSSDQMQILNFCNQHGILVGGYSPFGVPDRRSYPSPPLPSGYILQNPDVLAIAANHNATPSQIILAWHSALSIPTQSRSQNAIHMAENLSVWPNITLSAAEVKILSSQQQDTCTIDPHWYECNGTS